jgi:hypothetical protein
MNTSTTIETIATMIRNAVIGHIVGAAGGGACLA